MVFETKLKVLGKRHTGTLRVKVQPSDKENKVKDWQQEEGESLMVIGKFDCGVNDGVRRWSFKGYRDRERRCSGALESYLFKIKKLVHFNPKNAAWN